MVRRLVVVMYAGTVATVFGLSMYHAAAHDYSYTGSSRFAWTIAYLALLILASYSAGLPDVRAGRSRFATAAIAAGAAAIPISAIQLALGSAILPRFVVFGSAVALTVWWWLIARWSSRVATAAGESDLVVFVGGDSAGEILRHDIDVAPELPAQLVATAPPASVKRRHRSDEPLVDLVINANASVVVLDRDAQAIDDVVAQASILHESGVRVRTLTGFYEEWLGKLPASELERLSLMFDIREIHELTYARVKRLVDVVFGIVGTVVCIGVVPFVLMGNAVANRGGLMYRQTRVGRSGKAFTILKFRTMRPSPDNEDAEWTSENDPRVTRFGHVLRRTHLDELPQFVNILKGELSLVGPRPEQPHYVQTLTDKLAFYDLRHLVRPGLTGWAQVKYGYAGNERDALEKLQYEFFYLGHQGLALDARIVMRTLRSVFGSRGR